MGYFDDFLDFDPDSDIDFGGDLRCKGKTQAGKRCRVSVDSPYPTARTIASTGYCTQHLSQRGAAGGPARHFVSRNGDVYPEDKPHPAIVQAARQGNLGKVRQLLAADPAQLNACRKRTEVEEKWGYDKSWTWDDDTPLIAAARAGNHDIVAELVCAGADPTRKSCPSDDVHETALQAADSGLSRCKAVLASRPRRVVARSELERQRAYECVRAILTAALEAWPLPALPQVPAAPSAPQSAASMTVEQLKAVLRRHGQKLAGKKADLVQRVEAGRYLEVEFEQAENDRSRIQTEAEAKRAQVQQSLADHRLKIRALAVPARVTDEEVEALAGPDPPPAPHANTRMSKRPLDPPLPEAKRARFDASSSSGAMATPFGRASVSTGSRGRPRCGCGRDFVNAQAMKDHQTHSKSCKFSSAFGRGRF